MLQKIRKIFRILYWQEFTKFMNNLCVNFEENVKKTPGKCLPKLKNFRVELKKKKLNETLKTIAQF